MCEICHRTPCDSRCPNAPEPPVYCLCDNCGAPIYDGDDYYHLLDGNRYCEECINDARETAEVDE